MLRFIKLSLATVLVGLLTACASGVSRMDGATASTALTDSKIKSINVWLNEGAKKLVADNSRFNQETLKTRIETAFKAQGLLTDSATQIFDLEITGFRVRSNFSAIAFGFMAGNDNIEGIITIKDGAGKTLKRAQVKASYALGGVAGGQDEARMGWLYDELTKHAVTEVVGVTAK